jgi:hypothetical protein
MKPTQASGVSLPGFVALGGYRRLNATRGDVTGAHGFAMTLVMGKG